MDMITLDKPFSIETCSAEDTMALGAKIAELLKPGNVLALYGELGSGKTTLVRGIARGLGVGEQIEITSPTFVLMNVYPGRMPIYHFDLYRLSGAADLYDLGFEDYFYGNGLSIIEWAEKAEILIPTDAIRLKLSTISDDKRRIQYNAR